MSLTLDRMPLFAFCGSNTKHKRQTKRERTSNVERSKRTSGGRQLRCAAVPLRRPPAHDAQRRIASSATMRRARCAASRAATCSAHCALRGCTAAALAAATARCGSTAGAHRSEKASAWRLTACAASRSRRPTLRRSKARPSTLWRSWPRRPTAARRPSARRPRRRPRCVALALRAYSFRTLLYFSFLLLLLYAFLSFRNCVSVVGNNTGCGGWWRNRKEAAADWACGRAGRWRGARRPKRKCAKPHCDDKRRPTACASRRRPTRRARAS